MKRVCIMLIMSDSIQLFSTESKINNYIVSLQNEVSFSFIHASGPGGQNVNKVATAVQLKFDILNSSLFSEGTKLKLIHLAGKRVSDQGIITIEAKRYRSQEKNKADAFERLVALIELAIRPVKKRTQTRPSKKSVEKRLTEKRQHGLIKSNRKATANHGDND
jgi:ribosome-associated protein